MTARLRAADADAVADVLAGLEQPVDVLLELGPTATPVTMLSAGGREVDSAAETSAVVSEVCGLSDLVSLEIVEHHEPGPWPQLTIGDGLVYRGMPLGYELSSLVYAIVEAGRGESSLSASSLERLATVAQPVEVRVYVTPT
jgi:alkyl hydroperoxide reductase subunit AhpF